jgi:hypothetical protein
MLTEHRKAYFLDAARAVVSGKNMTRTDEKAVAVSASGGGGYLCVEWTQDGKRTHLDVIGPREWREFLKQAIDEREQEVARLERGG